MEKKIKRIILLGIRKVLLKGSIPPLRALGCWVLEFGSLGFGALGVRVRGYGKEFLGEVFRALRVRVHDLGLGVPSLWFRV